MKVLVANRGEIAIRILRACRELGFQSVAVYSEVDKAALHTRYADEAVGLGPAAAGSSYLDIEALLKAARQTGAEAVHPGYGFLAENAEFAQAVEAEGLIFIGPHPETIRLTGDKLAARRAARSAGLPVLPGPDIPILEAIPVDLAEQVTFPVLIKAVQGGGGRGIRLAQSPEELAQMIAVARAEAQAAFGDGSLYLEPLVQKARHIEVQLFGDGQGQVLCLGERECSIQRRRQKLIEEAPAPGLSQPLRQHLFDLALHLGQVLHYRSLGTVEFLLDPNGEVHFIEVNPRIQVEHAVTEMVTGIDLVQAQLKLAAGQLLEWSQEQIESHGCAIEARVLAEDASEGFMPTTGEITHLELPGGPGVRVDTALYVGMSMTTDYDSLLAKVVGWGQNRQQAGQRLRRALEELQVGGLTTDVNFLLSILRSHAFLAGRVDTTYLDHFRSEAGSLEEGTERELALAVALAVHQSRRKNEVDLPEPSSLWKQAAWREQMHRMA